MLMKGTLSDGVCGFCGKPFSKAAISRHLDSCRQRKATFATTLGPKTKYLHLVVEGRHLPEYWMHLEVRADAQLRKLDDFLRGIWLECCGHLSAFTIDGKRYVSEVIKHPLFDLEPEKGMNIKIGKVLEPKMKFSYEYDFGTTTELNLRVISERIDQPGKEPVRLMARNTAPSIVCNVCGKPATQVCTQCIWEGEGWLCDACARKHKCGEEMLLPVVNSPRVGMCAYTGAAE
jgi:hypothetical protein